MSFPQQPTTDDGGPANEEIMSTSSSVNGNTFAIPMNLTKQRVLLQVHLDLTAPFPYDNMAALSPEEAQKLSSDANDPSTKSETKEADTPCDSKDDNVDDTKSPNTEDKPSEKPTDDQNDQPVDPPTDDKPSADDIKDNSNDEEKKYEPPQDDTQPLIPQNLEPKPLGKKNKVVIGSFEPSTFHYSFKNQKDPLQIGMFPVFGYLQVPHIGVYGDSFGMK